MKKCLSNFYFIITLLLFTNSIYCQSDSTVAIESLMKAVVYLQDERPQTEQINGKTYEVGVREIGKKEFEPLKVIIYGTGFFVKNNNKLFLVTAEHVAKDLKFNSSLITSDNNGNAIQYPLNSKLKWEFCTVADAAVSIVSDSTLISIFQPNAIDFNLLPDHMTYPVAELPLVVIGFPLQYGSKGKFSPLRRETNAASALIDLPRADTKQISTFFILQDPSIGGYSGAPVFVIETHSFGNALLKGFNANMCIGLMHGTAFDDTGGKLGLVVPMKYVCDLLK